LPSLAIIMDGAPMAAAPLAVALGSAALSLAWIAAGIAGFRSPAWPGRMFAASLAYLVLVFGALLAIGL
jgi:heme O synthase-like polyprenyltransferase